MVGFGKIDEWEGGLVKMFPTRCSDIVSDAKTFCIVPASSLLQLFYIGCFFSFYLLYKEAITDIVQCVVFNVS